MHRSVPVKIRLTEEMKREICLEYKSYWEIQIVNIKQFAMHRALNKTKSLLHVLIWALV